MGIGDKKGGTMKITNLLLFSWFILALAFVSGFYRDTSYDEKPAEKSFVSVFVDLQLFLEFLKDGLSGKSSKHVLEQSDFDAVRKAFGRWLREFSRALKD